MQTGSLRIGSFGATSSLQILPRLLEKFHKAHPSIEVLIEEAADEEVAGWIGDRRVDLGFVVLPDDRFQTWPLAKDQFVALVPAGSSLAKQSAVSLDELCDALFIMPESGTAGIIRRLFTQSRLRPRVRYRTSQVLSTLTMVARGQGVSVVAEMALPPETGKEDWVRKPMNPVRTRKIGLAMHLQPTEEQPATLKAVARGLVSIDGERAPILETPRDYGLEFEDVTFATEDSVKLAAWFIPAVGSDKLIICIHPATLNRYGFPGHLKPWSDFQNVEVKFGKIHKALHDAGYNVLAYDPRNHGESDCVADNAWA